MQQVESATMSLRQSFRTITDRFATETDPDKRKQILQDEYLPALAEETAPDIPIIKSMTIFGVRSNVKGLEYTSGADLSLQMSQKSKRIAIY